ncbi:MAG: tyrosine-type recombinase/integrase [Proteobacteria bacterium]|nr:tyrosine-type recombinase/integrase [Pseudomonadota bacterium]
MTNRDIDLRETSIPSENCTIPAINSFNYYQPRLRFESHLDGSVEALRKILGRLAGMDLPGEEHVENYLRHMTRGNRRPKTLYSRWGTLLIFLGMIRDNGKTRLEEITRRDVEAFIEHEQDRGIKITTIRMRLTGVQSFLRHLAEDGIVSPDIFGKRIRLQLPERLPRAMEPSDLQKLLSVIEGARDRAMIMVLLRTGMRIGELLITKVTDVHIKERRIEIYEGEKNRLGRVVYLSDDAVIALKAWLKERNTWEEYLIYSQGRTDTMSYSTARSRFAKYIVKAGLTHKGYTLHTLRHTFATELLNAGMRLECLQVLLGHRNIEETRRYARLTDKTREEEYFKAMSRIERGNSNGDDRCDHELEAIFEKEELFTEYR